MKIPVFFVLLLLSFSITAQQRFQDDFFQVAPTGTYTYATKGQEALKLDVYTPERDSMRARPVIIFMHGGGFAGGSRNNHGEVAFARAAAQKGYVAVQISYRLTRKGQSFSCDYAAKAKKATFRMAAEDFLDAVKFLINHKKEFRIDPSRIIVGGSSAGAEAVLNAIYNERLLFEELSRYQDLRFSGVFSLAGAVLDSRYITTENVVPGIFFHGTEDNLVPYGSGPHHWCDRREPGYIILDGSRSITAKLKNLGTPYLLYSFQGGKHEHARMPEKYFPEIFTFMRRVFLNKEKLQAEIVL